MAAAPPAQEQQAPQQARKISIRKLTDADSDRTWLETILKEKKAQKDWEGKWGFILDLHKERDDAIAKLPRPSHRKNKVKDFKAKVKMEAQPSPPIPPTSSAIVGWRCSSGYWLESFGPMYVSPRLTIDPPPDTRPDSEDEELQDGCEDVLDMKLDKRRSGLYTTSVILLK
ncbi:ciliary microtubule inner protein 1-like [Hetaerina americana]|uniref:ciliary microtubule inner protein 1-like n=1 Tax=Hetaerina americana TaxID=62018 RepID=UPI003A7F2D3D